MNRSQSYFALLRVWLLTLLSSFVFVMAGLWSDARAHEIQPAILDYEVVEGTMEIRLQMTLESAVAGLDLQGLFDTNESERAEEYDRLRELGPVEFENAFRSYFPTLQEKLTLRAGDEAFSPDLLTVQIPEVGNTELARTSVVTMQATPPEGTAPFVIGWTGDLGPLVVRDIGSEDGYTAFLQNGALSDPIPRSGGSGETGWSAFVTYIQVGFDHIIPKGLDHILFVLGLFFLALKLRPLLWQVTAFTLAHTVTLALGALEIVRIPGEIVEPIIAASIVYVGVENVLSKGLTPWRPVIVFLFGLLHGLGFASVLADFGLGATYFVPKLIGFNVGVELGQLAVIAIAFILVGYWFGQKPWYKARIANPASLIIAAIGAYWVVERTLL